MPRIIVFLLTIAMLAILTLQNLATEVPLVVLGTTVATAVPLGLLILATVGIGTLLTLIFYGLVGTRRPPESKYKPMGRRVPYPESPDSSPLPDSRPSDSSFSSPPPTGYSSSSAFVSEPETVAPPFVTPPQERPVRERPVQDTPPASVSSVPVSEPPTADSQMAQDSSAKPPSSYFQPQSSTYTPANDASNQPPTSDSTRSGNPIASTFVQQPIAGLKSVFGKKKDREDEPEVLERPIGDDWGQRRTKEHINSWDTSEDEPSRLEEGAKSLLNFGRNVGTNAGRLAEDIASGWNTQPTDNRDGDRAVYRDSNARYEDPDQGWESFDDYGEPPPQGERFARRTYGESLYGNDDLDDGYADEAYADDIGPDGVYDADYKVIVPPSKPLVDDDDNRPNS